MAITHQHGNSDSHDGSDTMLKLQITEWLSQHPPGGGAGQAACQGVVEEPQLLQGLEAIPGNPFWGDAACSQRESTGLQAGQHADG